MAVELVQDFAWASFLLVLGCGLRARVKLFQLLYIPAAVIAGLIGLMLGPEVLGRISPFYISFSHHIFELAMPLLAVVFCTQFIGAALNRNILGQSLTTCLLNCGTACLQTFLGLTLVGLSIFGERMVPLGLGLMPFTGFYGGHGIAAAVSDAFSADGHWSVEESLSVGNTFATFGLLFGVVVGIVIINVAARKGLLADGQGNAGEWKDDSVFFAADERPAAIEAITKNDALNPLAFCLAVIGGVLFLSYLLLDQIRKIPFLEGITITVPVIFVGAAVSFLVQKTGLERYLDRKSLLNTSGAAMEYLIVTSVATARLQVFLDFGLEIALLTAVLLVATTGYVLFFGRLWHRENWVENTLGTFGLATGVLATGFLLIRMADPENRTGAASHLAIGNSISTLTVQMFLLSVFPTLLVRFPLASVLLVGCGLVLFTAAGCVLFRE